MSYVSLHAHSDGSLLDGMSTVSEMAQFAADSGQTATAITDHGNLYNALKFQTACEERGVKPVLGCEVYVAPRTIADRDASIDRKAFHLILLAQNDEGWRNLVTLVTRASLEGMYYKPRVDRAMLAEHNAGLIALSGCLGSELSQNLLAGASVQAEHGVVAWYAETFPGRYYLELQDHGQEEDRTVIEGTLAISRSTGLPLVATQDSHYTHRAEADIHDTMLCMQTMGKKTDEKRFRFSGGPYSLQTDAEMEARFGMYPGAVENSGLIAEQCSAHIAVQHAMLPEFQLEERHYAALR
jgi:DNA polymerase-3 subunit alpha